jgi:hypothetical protein
VPLFDGISKSNTSINLQNCKIAKLCIAKNARNVQHYANSGYGNRGRGGTCINQIGKILQKFCSKNFITGCITSIAKKNQVIASNFYYCLHTNRISKTDEIFEYRDPVGMYYEKNRKFNIKLNSLHYEKCDI